MAKMRKQNNLTEPTHVGEFVCAGIWLIGVCFNLYFLLTKPPDKSGHGYLIILCISIIMMVRHLISGIVKLREKNRTNHKGSKRGKKEFRKLRRMYGKEAAERLTTQHKHSANKFTVAANDGSGVINGTVTFEYVGYTCEAPVPRYRNPNKGVLRLPEWKIHRKESDGYERSGNPYLGSN